MDTPIIIEFLGSAGMENIDGYDCWPTTVMRPDVEETGLPRPFQCDEPYVLVPLVECDTCGGIGDSGTARIATTERGMEYTTYKCPACWGGWQPKGGYVYDGPDGRWLHIRLGGD
uniref:Uncharacterized protein n=1 Tax=viral metagenome TaxID=1070528 RepID=A0A6M3LQT2_9ZZZZ